MPSLLAAASMPQTRSDDERLLLALTARANAANTSLKSFLRENNHRLVVSGETVYLRDQAPELQEKWFALHLAVTEGEKELIALRKKMGIADFAPTPAVVTVRDRKVAVSDVLPVRIVGEETNKNEESGTETSNGKNGLWFEGESFRF